MHGIFQVTRGLLPYPPSREDPGFELLPPRVEPILNDLYSSLNNSHLPRGKKCEINPVVN